MGWFEHFTRDHKPPQFVKNLFFVKKPHGGLGGPWGMVTCGLTAILAGSQIYLFEMEKKKTLNVS